MEKMILIRPGSISSDSRLGTILDAMDLTERVDEVIESEEQLHPIQSRKILFAISLDESGINLEWSRMLGTIRRDPWFFYGCTGGVIVDGVSELYTKSVGREAVLTANLAGCMFPGRGLVEGTGSLHNYEVAARNLSVDLPEAYQIYARELDHRVKGFTAWDPDKYYLGVEGDYLAVRADDLTDIYIIAKSVFERTYRLTEE